MGSRTISAAQKLAVPVEWGQGGYEESQANMRGGGWIWDGRGTRGGRLRDVCDGRLFIAGTSCRA